MRAATWSTIGVALLLTAGQAWAQAPRSQSFGGGVHFQGYDFDKTLGADVANLTLFPVAYRLPVGDRFSADLYAAYARGAVERQNRTFTLDGLVDTRVRGTFQATPWAILTVAVNLPTGNATHDSGEALVANILATDLLGFREASWGTGLAMTSGVATAYRAGDWGMGFGVSYRMAEEFEPSADTSFQYNPGDETRFRVGIDRTFGDSKLTAGFTFQQFTSDRVDGRNLFQSGNRMRGDLTYAFRTGRATWNAYVAEIWRENGDVTLDIVGQGGEIVGDTTFQTPNQNLLVVGITGAVQVAPGFSFRPAADIRVQSREDETGEGWIFGLGGDVPLRFLGTYDLFPRARWLFGQMKSVEGTSRTLWGAELGLTLRWQP